MYLRVYLTIFLVCFLFFNQIEAQVTATCTPVDISCGFSQGGTRTGQFSGECLGDFILNSGTYEATGCVSTVIGNSDTFQFDENVRIVGDMILDLNAPGSVFEVLAGFTLEITGNLVIIGNSNAERQLSIEGNLIVGGILDFGERGGGTDQDVEIDGNGSISAGSINNGGNTTCEDSGSCPSFSVDGSCEPAGSGLCTEDPLPIQLASFKLKTNSNTIRIYWSTASEENNDYFTIQRSPDGINYDDITTVSGAGNSTVALEYEFIDRSPIYGSSYYRLKQTDFDGTSETFAPVAVEFTSLIEGNLVFTNPINAGDDITIYTNTDSREELQLVIYSMLGEQLFNSSFTGSEHTFSLDASTKAGIYFVRVSSASTQKTGRLVIQ